MDYLGTGGPVLIWNYILWCIETKLCFITFGGSVPDQWQYNIVAGVKWMPPFVRGPVHSE